MGRSAGTPCGLVNVVHYAVHGAGLSVRCCGHRWDDCGHGSLGRCGGRLGGGYGGRFSGLGANIAPAPAEEYAAEHKAQCENCKFLHDFPSYFSLTALVLHIPPDLDRKM